MRTYKDAKAMAKSLRDILAVKNVTLSHSECLEIVAQQFGFADWNTLSSKLGVDDHRPVLTNDPSNRLQPLNQAAPPTALGIERVPVLPIRDIVVYPGLVIPIFAGRSKTQRAAHEAMRTDKTVLLVLQRQPQVSDPAADDLFQIGTLAEVVEVSEFRKNSEASAADVIPTSSAFGTTQRIVVKGISRARVDMLYVEEYVSAHITVLNDDQAQDLGGLQPIRATVMTRFAHYAERTGWPPKAWNAPPRADLLGLFGGFDAGRFADTIAAHIPMPLTQKQEVLEILDVRKRLEYLDETTRNLE